MLYNFEFLSEGLVLVYVTAIIVVMVRQFRMLNSLEEEDNRLLVVNTWGDTEVESLRWGQF